MGKFIWRVRFAFAVHSIFAKPKRAFTGSSYSKLRLGWRVSGCVYEDYKGMEPYQAALDEITEWYS